MRLRQLADANDPWPGLVQDIFNNREMNDGADVIAIEMPYRAEDAAIVPVTLRTKLPAGDSRRVLRITLVIDQNPAPMAAKFELGPDANVSEISTRVRVNNYTDVHAVAELSDGKLYMAKTYVKASGGCSAPAAKNADEARSRLGQMRYRQFARPGQGPASGAREAQIMIGHPSNSGLQMDQVTQLYMPAFFVDQLRLWQDDSLVLAMEGGISISEDPNIRFTYVSNGAKRFRAEARDTDGHIIPERMEDRRLQHVKRDIGLGRFDPRPLLEASHFGFGLRTPEIVERACRLFGGAELAAHITANLRHAQHGFGRDIALIGQQRCDDVDRTGALFDRLPRLAIRFHAAEDVFRPRRSRVVVDFLGSRGHGRRHDQGERGDNSSYQSDTHHRLPPAAKRGSYAMTAPLKRKRSSKRLEAR